jgi:hypothetical protein
MYIRLQRMFVFRQELTLTLKLALILFASAFFNAGCRQTSEIRLSENKNMPGKILWAWERREDLRFLDATRFGVAFLAQTVLLQNDNVILRPRRQSLQVAANTYLIAVTRLETGKQSENRPDLSDNQNKKVVSLIKKTLELPNVKAVQVDFDVTISERDFYRRLIYDLKTQLPEDTPLTITALASWCAGDTWFSDFPIDEAVPMVFEMGADDELIRKFLIDGNDWREPLCRKSYGIAIDETVKADFQPNRRRFYFKSKVWEKADLEKLDLKKLN